MSALNLVLKSSIFLLFGCSHRNSVDSSIRDPIIAIIEDACPDHSCELGSCWWVDDSQTITGKKMFCDVNFTFTSSVRQEELLTNFSKELSIDQLSIGLCGRHSLGTQFLQTLFFVPVTAMPKSSILAGFANQPHTSDNASQDICSNTTYFLGTRK